MILIIAGNQGQALYYARVHALKLAEFRYVENRHSLQGYNSEGAVVLSVGQPWSHRNVGGFHEMIARRAIPHFLEHQVAWPTNELVRILNIKKHGFPFFPLYTHLSEKLSVGNALSNESNCIGGWANDQYSIRLRYQPNEIIGYRDLFIPQTQNSYEEWEFEKFETIKTHSGYPYDHAWLRVK